MSREQLVGTEKHEGIGVVTMNNPQALNSLHPDLIEQLMVALQEMEEDSQIKVIILTGKGKAFCAGGDLPYLDELSNAREAQEYIKKAGQIVATIVKLKKPVVAMVNGAAAGAGFNLVLACDVVFCAESAKFIQSFANVGLIPDCGGMYFLPRRIGLAKAKELMFTAEPLKAGEALELGLVNHVINDAELEEKTWEYCEKLAQGPPLAINYMKSVLNKSYGLDLEELLELEASLQSICLQTEDNNEGIRAFREKRKPLFKGV